MDLKIEDHLKFKNILELLQVIALSLIQGFTEFLPISSSAHLLIPHHVFDWRDQGLAFDVAVHLGSLLAVISYFHKDIWKLIVALIQYLRTGHHTENSQFAYYLLIGSLPLLILGLIGRDWIEINLRTLQIIIISTVLFAPLLLAADLFGNKKRKHQELDLYSAIFIGATQILALIPGASRSGVTITAALFLGFNRESASRISFMMAIPAIAGASFVKLFDLATREIPVQWTGIILGIFTSGIAAFTCITLFLKLIDRVGFLPFVLYRLLLGSILFFTI